MIEEEDDGFDEWKVKNETQQEQGDQEQQEIEQMEEEESQEMEELGEEEGVNKRIGKTWEETFSRSMEKLRGGRKRMKPVRFTPENKTEEGSRDRNKQDSPKQRKRKQSLARHGGRSPGEAEQGEYVRLPSGSYIRRTLEGEK